jgi:hypothetical protein
MRSTLKFQAFAQKFRNLPKNLPKIMTFWAKPPLGEGIAAKGQFD